MTHPSNHSSTNTGDAQGTPVDQSPTNEVKKQRTTLLKLGPLKITRIKSYLKKPKDDVDSEPSTLLQKYFTCSGGSCVGGSPPSRKGANKEDAEFLED